MQLELLFVIFFVVPYSLIHFVNARDGYFIDKQISIANLPKVHLFFRPVDGSPGHESPGLGDKKRAKRSHLPKQFVVGISYAAKIPLRSVALALQGSDSDHAQDALRVLDIVLRQQQAKRYGECYFTLCLSLQCHSDCNYVCCIQRLPSC